MVNNHGSKEETNNQQCQCSEGGGGRFRVALDINKAESKLFAWLWIPRTAGLRMNWLAERLRSAFRLREDLIIEALPAIPGGKARLVHPSDPLAIVDQSDTIIVHVIGKNVMVKELAVGATHHSTNQPHVKTISTQTTMHLGEDPVPDIQATIDHVCNERKMFIENTLMDGIADKFNQNQSIEEPDQQIEEPNQQIEEPNQQIKECQNSEQCRTDERNQHIENGDEVPNDTFESMDIITDNENITDVLQHQQQEQEDLEDASYAEAFKAVHQFYKITKEHSDDNVENHQDVVDGSNANEVVKTDIMPAHDQPTVNYDIHCINNKQTDNVKEAQTVQNGNDKEDYELSKKREAALRLLDEKIIAMPLVENKNGELNERRRRRRVRRRKRPASYNLEPDLDDKPNSTQHTKVYATPPAFDGEWASKKQKITFSPSTQDTCISTPRSNKQKTQEFRIEKLNTPTTVLDECDCIDSPIEVQSNIKYRGNLDSGHPEIQNRIECPSQHCTRAASEIRTTPASSPAPVVRASPVPSKGRLVRAI